MREVIAIMEVIGINEFERIAVLRLLLASLCGGLIGLEREMKGRPAGLKTFSLVCMGATLAMITNEYMVMYLSGGNGDIARMAAQVISGIGFLGAGTIMVTGHNRVKGLTTAASLWVTASLGIAIGTGFYFGGIVCVIIIFVCSRVYGFIDCKIMERARVMRIYVEGINEEFMLQLVSYFGKKEIKVLSLTRKSENKWYKKDTCAVIELDLGRKRKHSEILSDINLLEGLRYVEEI